MLKDDDEQQLAQRMAAELLTHPPVEVHLTATGALHLVGLLQLVLRHPMLAASSRATAIAVVEQLRVYFVDTPATLEVIRRGDDPSQDRRPDPTIGGGAARRPS